MDLSSKYSKNIHFTNTFMTNNDMRKNYDKLFNTFVSCNINFLIHRSIYLTFIISSFNKLFCNNSAQQEVTLYEYFKLLMLSTSKT